LLSINFFTSAGIRTEISVLEIVVIEAACPIVLLLPGVDAQMESHRSLHSPDFSVALGPELRARLEEISERLNRRKAHLVREALSRYLDTLDEPSAVESNA